MFGKKLAKLLELAPLRMSQQLLLQGSPVLVAVVLVLALVLLLVLALLLLVLAWVLLLVLAWVLLLTEISQAPLSEAPLAAQRSPAPAPPQAILWTNAKLLRSPNNVTQAFPTPKPLMSLNLKVESCSGV